MHNRRLICSVIKISIWIQGLMLGVAGCSSAVVAKPFRVAVPNPIHALNPAEARIVQEKFLLPLLFQPLFRLDSQGNLTPDLAQKVRSTKKNVIEIEIRQGQTFWDNSPVTADDVVFTAKELCNSRAPAPNRLWTIEGCSSLKSKQSKLGVRKIAERTIEFKIVGHENSFLQELASSAFLIFKQVGKTTVGSGPYRIEDHKPEKVIITKRSASTTGAETIEFTYVKESEIERAMNENRVDLAAMYLTDTVKKIGGGSRKVIYNAPYVTKTLVLNPNATPFNNVTLRTQIYNAVQSEARLDQCHTEVVRATSIVPEGIGGHHLVPIKAGQAPQKRIRLSPRAHVTIHQAADRQDPCEIDRLRKVFDSFNIDANFQPETDYPALLRKYGTNKIDGFLELFVFLSRDASRFFFRFTSNTPEPYLYFTSKKIDQLLIEAMEKPTITQRFETYRKITDLVSQQHNAIPLYYIGTTNVFRSCIQFIDMNSLGISNANPFLMLERIQWPAEC